MPIDYKIERKRFEQIGDQLGAILTDEMYRQGQDFEVDECREVTVYRERITTIDAEEKAVVNVLYAETGFDNKHQGSSAGSNTYYIDIYAVEPSTRSGEDGDKLAALKLQRLMGIVWEILEHPIYKTLSLAAPSISGLMVANMEIVNAKENDSALAMTFGRITVNVRAVEETGRSAGNALTSSITQIKLVETEKGYRYEHVA